MYHKNFFNDQKNISVMAAREIVPLVTGMIHPKTVVDVGCGIGAWLAEFKKYGVSTIVGIDGKWVPVEDLRISIKDFKVYDLSKPFKIKKNFDLVVCVEVAEHLEERHAKQFVRTLTNLGPAILFSAAVPYQGGENHVNEQWQSYWITLFRQANYQVIDCIRPLVWHNNAVAPVYRQNTFLFIRKSKLHAYRKINHILTSNQGIYDVIHPEHYESLVKIVRVLHRWVPRFIRSIGMSFIGNR